MKIIAILLPLLIFLCVAMTLGQVTPDLAQLALQLQKTPADNALREKIVKLAATVKPALPEEAERRLARGKAAYKGAKSVLEYQNAIKEYQAAVDAAPWWGDAYFNLGFVQDKAEKYVDALQSLKWALIASPDDKEIKALIYEVEYRNEQAVKTKVDTDTTNAWESSAKAFEGEWYSDFYSSSGVKDRLILTITRTGKTEWTIARRDEMSGSSSRSDPHFSGYNFDGQNLRFRHQRGVQYPDHFEVEVEFEVTAAIDASRSQLTLNYKPLPFATAERASHWAGYGYGPPKSSTDVYKKLN